MSVLAGVAPWSRAPVGHAGARAVDGGDLDDAAEPLPGAEEPADPAREPQVLPAPPAAPPAAPPSADEIVPSGAPADVDDVSEPAPPDVDVPSEGRNAGSPRVASGDDEPWPSLRAASVRRSPATDGGGHASGDPPPFMGHRHRDPRVDPGAPAGAYLPPTEPVELPGARAAAVPAGTAPSPWALIRTHRAPRPSGPVPETFRAATIERGTSVALPPPAAPRSSPPRPVGDLLADLPFRVPEDTAARLVVAGSALASLAFLLPWTSTPAVDAGYTSEWGFAVASYVIPWLAAVALLLVGLLPGELSAWAQSPVPLALGSFLLGLAWPYVVGPAGSHLGSWAVAVAGMVLIAGGLTKLRVTPGEAPTSSV